MRTTLFIFIVHAHRMYAVTKTENKYSELVIISSSTKDLCSSTSFYFYAVGESLQIICDPYKSPNRRPNLTTTNF